MRRAFGLAVGLLVACASEHEHAFTFTPDASGRLSIRASIVGGDAFEHGVAFAIDGAEVRVRTAEGWFSTARATCEAGPARLSCDVGEGLRVSVVGTMDGEQLTLTTTVAASRAHVLEGVELLSTTTGGALTIPANPLRYVHNGYQSWSYAGTLALAPDHLAPRGADGRIDYAAPNGTTLDEIAGLSSHSIVLPARVGGATLGFLGASRWQGAFALESRNGTPSLVAFNGFTGDTVSLAPGAEVELEPLFVSWSPDVAASMGAYGRAVAARQAKGMGGAGSEVPGHLGWFTWNRFFARIDDGTTTRVANAWDDAGAGLPSVVVDDGWERAWGDWHPNEKFPEIKALATTHADRGRRVGLWLAPFLVEERLEVVGRHPDWWVRNRDGTPLVHRPAGLPKALRVLDTTHPDAMAWLTGRMAELARDGVGFFKIDFLYAAAFDGLRHDDTATGVEALERGLEALFEATPTARYNLCGVPWLHAMLAPPATVRVGADVTFDGPGGGFVTVAWAARNAAARAFGPLVARSDLDQFVLKGLTDAETQTALLWMAAIPHAFALADDPTELNGAQHGLVRRVLGLVRPFAAARPTTGSAPDLFSVSDDVLRTTPLEELLSDRSRPETAVPSTLVVNDRAVVTNWGDAPLEVELPFEQSASLVGPAPNGRRVTLAPYESGLYERGVEAR